MSRRNRESIENLSGLQELDRLVVEVIRALQSRSMQGSQLTQDNNVIYREQWGEAEFADEQDVTDFDPDEGHVRQRRKGPKSPLDDAEWQEGGEVPVTENWSGPLPEELEEREEREESEQEPGLTTEPEASVLSEAELAFIDRTCRWLERRPHRDIILDQIWRNLLPKDSMESPVDEAGEQENIEDDGDTGEGGDESD